MTDVHAKGRTDIDNTRKEKQVNTCMIMQSSEHTGSRIKRHLQALPSPRLGKHKFFSEGKSRVNCFYKDVSVLTNAPLMILCVLRVECERMKGEK